MRRTLHISEKEISFQANLLFGSAARGESGTVMCYPGCKIDYNLNCFLDSPEIKRAWLGKYHNRFVFLHVIFSAESNKEEILDQIRESVAKAGIAVNRDESFADIARKVVTEGKELFIFLNRAEVASLAVLEEILGIIHREIVTRVRVGGLLLLEKNIHDPQLARLLAKNYKFLQNVEVMPVYSTQEAIYFTQTLADDFGLTLPTPLQQEIVATCGGYLWLLRGALRELADHSSFAVGLEDIRKSHVLKARVASIFDQLSSEERTVLSRIASKQYTDLDPDIVEYFLSLGVIAPGKKNGFEITSALLGQQAAWQAQFSEVSLSKDKKPLYQNEDISRYFSEREQELLALLLEHRGSIVSREQIARCLWAQDWAEHYSDWAIDKTISRIRQILVAQGAPRGVIKTKKGQGFLVE